MNVLTKEHAERIKTKAKESNACIGQYRKFCAYLEADDLAGCTRIIIGDWLWIEARFPEELEGLVWVGVGEVWSVGGHLIERATYKNGRPDGLCETWYSNGKKKTRFTAKEGMPDGLFESWNEDGKMVRCVTYKDGKAWSGDE